jgi:hypothetical protein
MNSPTPLQTQGSTDSFHIPLAITGILWLPAAIFLSISISALVSTSLHGQYNGIVAASALGFGGVFFYLALIAASWKVSFTPSGLKWRWLFLSKTIPFSDIGVMELDVKRATKGGKTAYFTIRLKSGACLKSPPLGVDLASALDSEAKRWLETCRSTAQ